MMKQYVPANWPHQENPSNKWRSGNRNLCLSKSCGAGYPNLCKSLNTCKAGCPTGDRVKMFPVSFDE